MDYYIKEYIGIDKIKIGMSLDEIKKQLFNEKYSIFEESNPLYPYKICCNDYMVFLNSSKVCNMIDFYRQSSKVVFKNKNIIGEKYIDIINFFKSINGNICFSQTGFMSLKYDISVYKEAHDFDPTEAIIRSVSVFEKNGCKKFIDFLEKQKCNFG